MNNNSKYKIIKVIIIYYNDNKNNKKIQTDMVLN